ncbi:MAG: Na/Pi cotransporter family protein [Oscillospiraceae bacterium]|nr:Na/Pi cotransporter family protein [Oscillospiraceae bacterium]
MNIFSLFTLCGGIAFFLYGMSLMSSRLEKLAGGRMEQMLKKMTSTPIKGLLLGAGITIAIQSSGAVTVMLVGLVNSGILELGQSIGIIMGSNVGTTLTAWILSLSGIDSDSIWLQLLKPENFSPIVALIGVILRTVHKTGRKHSVGSIMVGFSILMYGTTMMKNAVSPLADMPEFTSILTAFTNPFIGVLVGAVLTAVLHSSAASVGILQALSMTGGITYGMALPIIMGQNIGTCMTSLMSSIGGNRNARRVSVIHVSFNLIGTAIGLLIFYGSGMFIQYAFMGWAIDPKGIAIVHSIFNVATTLLLLPFSKQLEKLAYLVVREDAGEKEEKLAFLDERLLNTPSVAIAECANKTVEMAKLAQDTILRSLSLLGTYDEKTAEAVIRNEDRLDQYEDRLSTVLVQLSGKALSDEDSRNVSKQLHTIGDFERIGDHAVNLLKTAQEIHDKEIHFSGTAAEELQVLFRALTEILSVTTHAYAMGDLKLASRVEPLEQVIDGLVADIKSNHITRLQKGHCTIEVGFVLSDLLTNCERVSDHCSNIAVAQIETAQNLYQAHEYLNALKNEGDAAFRSKFDEYQKIFSVEKEKA